MVSVDGELDQALAFVDGLSTSPNFAKGDFVALQVQAREALVPYGYVLILKSADGHPQLPCGSPEGGAVFIAVRSPCSRREQSNAALRAGRRRALFFAFAWNGRSPKRVFHARPGECGAKHPEV
jgi:hypothetical protein